MASIDNYPINPGSFNEYALGYTGEAASPEELKVAYFSALSLFRARLAENYRISPEELHSLQFDKDTQEIAA